MKRLKILGSWMPLSVVNILRDMGVGFLDVQMYFKLLNVHALAMTTICTNPLLYFWMSKVHISTPEFGWGEGVVESRKSCVGLPGLEPSLLFSTFRFGVDA
jgi:hypothetical protein